MKRKISLILAVIIIFSLLPITAFAANNDKLIALTFDDGPGAYTKRLLDGLRARNVKCTFFLVGTGVERYPGLVKQMWLDGHEIASHTYDHPALTTKNNAQIAEQLKKSDALLDKAIGFDQSYMLRPPYGDFNSRVLSAVNTPCFYWSMDTYDWKTKNANSVYNEFLKQAKDGSLALLHDTHSTSVDAALRVIDTLKARGYEFVTVSEMFYRRGINLQAGNIYYNAYPGSYGTADGISEPVIKSANTDSGKQISIQGDSRGSVYYTTNGQVPTPANSKLYTGPFTISSTTTVKAVSVIKWNGLRSFATTAKIEYTPAEAPHMSLNEGMVEISCDTANSEIYYSADGTSPTKESTRYEESFAAVPGTSYRARAYAPSYDASCVSMLTYTENGNILTDVSVDDWCCEAIDRALSEGLFKGMTETEFGPNIKLSRAMLVQVLYRMQGSPDVSGLTQPFSDVPDDYWSRDAIIWAYSNGIVMGYDSDSFKPRNNISRQALCAMLARYMRFCGKDTSGIETGALEGFKDYEKVSASLKDDVDLICTLGIMQGYSDGTLRPINGASRAQAATMILRMEDAMADIPDVNPDKEPPEDTDVILIL